MTINFKFGKLSWSPGRGGWCRCRNTLRKLLTCPWAAGNRFLVSCQAKTLMKSVQLGLVPALSTVRGPPFPDLKTLTNHSDTPDHKSLWRWPDLLKALAHFEPVDGKGPLSRWPDKKSLAWHLGQPRHGGWWWNTLRKLLTCPWATGNGFLVSCQDSPVTKTLPTLSSWKTSLADSERTSAFSSILTVFGRHAAPLLEVVAWLVR